MRDQIVRDVRAAKEASRELATLSTETKNAVLRAIADQIEASRDEILEANARDMRTAEADGLASAKLQRLELTDASIAQLGAGVRQIADLPDPIGTTTLDRIVPSGLHVKKVRCPIGVIAMIYEARPGVTVDAFALCFKGGNACVLKGGKEANESNTALADLVRAVLETHGVPGGALGLVVSSDRGDLKRLLELDDCIDLVIPRGGEQLIRFVHEHSRIPTIQHFKGVCHIYVDASADVDQAIEICATAKTSAPATCNSAECLLVHESIAPLFLPKLAERLDADGVCAFADGAARPHMPGAEVANQDSWGREFLDLVYAVRVIDSMDDALAHIDRYGSNHTEAILTRDDANAKLFCERVQSSCVVVNASTRFNDGFQLGLGAEIGISTSKIHAYGPMGLEELTTQRWIVEGDGQTR